MCLSGWNFSALILVPAILGTLLSHPGPSASKAHTASESCSVERRAGSTKFADAHLYHHHLLLSAAQRAEYFRDGATVVRDAFPASLISALLEHVPVEIRHQPNAFWNNPWMHSDEFLDFLLYSNLGALVAQLHSSPETETAGTPPGDEYKKQTETAGTPPGVFLWKAFLGSRLGGGPGWHYDHPECDGDLPANYTARARVRVVIGLADDVPGTVVLNQSAYAAGMPEGEASLYWQGQLPHRLPPGQRYLLQERSSLPRLPGVNLVPSDATLVKPGNLRAGDVVVFNSCAWHTAPAEASLSGSELMFQPSFAAALSRVGLPEAMGGACKHGLKLGDRITASPGCFPQVFPQSATAPKGSRLQLQHDGCGRE